jgi:hypothetical protein
VGSVVVHGRLDDLDLLVGQSVQFVDDLVDEVVRALDLLVEFVGAFLRVEVVPQVALHAVGVGQGEGFEAVDQRVRLRRVLAEIGVAAGLLGGDGDEGRYQVGLQFGEVRESERLDGVGLGVAVLVGVVGIGVAGLVAGRRGYGGRMRVGALAGDGADFQLTAVSEPEPALLQDFVQDKLQLVLHF